MIARALLIHELEIRDFRWINAGVVVVIPENGERIVGPRTRKHGCAPAPLAPARTVRVAGADGMAAIESWWRRKPQLHLPAHSLETVCKLL